MMKCKFSLFLFTLFAIVNCPTAGLRAQAPEEAPELHTIRFRALSLGNPVDHLYAPDAGGEMTAMRIANVLPSNVYTYRGVLPMRLYERYATPEGDAYRPVIEVRGNPDGEFQLLLLSPRDPGDDSQIRAILLPDDLQRFPANHALLINTMPTQVAGALFEQKFTLAPGQLRIIELGNPEDESLPVKLAVRSGDNWNFAVRTAWSHKPDFRTLVLLVEDPLRPDNVKIQRFREHVSRVEKAHGLADE